MLTVSALIFTLTVSSHRCACIGNSLTVSNATQPITADDENSSLRDWLIVSSTWGMQTWASAVLSNQWLGHGAQRTSVRTVSVRGRGSNSSVVCGASETSRGAAHSFTATTQQKITWLFYSELIFNASSHRFYTLLLCSFFFSFVLERNGRTRIHCGQSISSSRPGNYVTMKNVGDTFSSTIQESQ